MFIFGTRLYGKVDHVPGLFYIATTFGHVNFLPLMPLQSYLVLDDGQERAIPLPTSWKSVLVAWFRAVGFVGGLFAFVGGLIEMSQPTRHSDPNTNILAFVLGLATLIMTVGSYWIFRAGRIRAVALALQVGIDPTCVHAYFDRIEGRSTPAFPTQPELLPPDAFKRWKEDNAGVTADE
jgi:hypothetical protein